MRILTSCSVNVLIKLFPDTDREFDPSADMLVHDFDDEGTMEEEEALSNADSVGNELSSLEKVSHLAGRKHSMRMIE